MNQTDLIAARRKAEESVADMPESPLKIKAFEVILNSLISRIDGGADIKGRSSGPDSPTGDGVSRPKSPSSLAERVGVLAEEGYLGEPRSLADIQTKLAEHGWHYGQANLSTPLIRLVRQRQLRRLQQTEGNKRVWKYSLP
jgi:hypothetical protein